MSASCPAPWHSFPGSHRPRPSQLHRCPPSSRGVYTWPHPQGTALESPTSPHGGSRGRLALPSAARHTPASAAPGDLSACPGCTAANGLSVLPISFTEKLPLTTFLFSFQNVLLIFHLLLFLRKFSTVCSRPGGGWHGGIAGKTPICMCWHHIWMQVQVLAAPFQTRSFFRQVQGPRCSPSGRLPLVWVISIMG